MSIPNRWHLRKVADASSKGCLICYKPTPWVLITADNKDFFYVCKGHLTDKSFCSPIIDQAASDKAAKEAQEREIEQLKKEYEEKQKRKEEKAKQHKKEEKEDEKKKDPDKDGDSQKKEKKNDDAASKSAEPTTAEKSKDGPLNSNTEEATPRIFALHKTFYQMRLDRLRTAEMARKNRERLQNPLVFPAVPKDGL